MVMTPGYDQPLHKGDWQLLVSAMSKRCATVNLAGDFKREDWSDFPRFIWDGWWANICAMGLITANQEYFSYITTVNQQLTNGWNEPWLPTMLHDQPPWLAFNSCVASLGINQTTPATILLVTIHLLNQLLHVASLLTWFIRVLAIVCYSSQPIPRLCFPC